MEAPFGLFFFFKKQPQWNWPSPYLSFFLLINIHFAWNWFSDVHLLYEIEAFDLQRGSSFAFKPVDPCLIPTCNNETDPTSNSKQSTSEVYLALFAPEAIGIAQLKCILWKRDTSKTKYSFILFGYNPE